MYNLNMAHRLEYIITPTCGFKTGHIYEVIITEADNAGYICSSKYDETDDEDIDIQIYLSSAKSVERYFKEVRDKER